MLKPSMLAAIYARKSTEQAGFDDEARSVARQVEHAKAFAQSKGWMLPYELTWQHRPIRCPSSERQRHEENQLEVLKPQAAIR